MLSKSRTATVDLFLAQAPPDKPRTVSRMRHKRIAKVLFMDILLLGTRAVIYSFLEKNAYHI
jgi:hypothetical protein